LSLFGNALDWTGAHAACAGHVAKENYPARLDEKAAKKAGGPHLTRASLGMINLVGLLGGRLAKRQAFAQRSVGGGVTA
jgi:hypothetical protein